jgi:hypothetical protein
MPTNNCLSAVFVVVNDARVRGNVKYCVPVSVTQTMDAMIHPILKSKRPFLSQRIDHCVFRAPKMIDAGLRCINLNDVVKEHMSKEV